MEIHGTKKSCNMKVKRSNGNILGGKMKTDSRDADAAYYYYYFVDKIILF